MHEIQISPIVRISEEVRDKRAQFEQSQGKPFLLFQRGEIDFDTPEEIRCAIKTDLDGGKTKYPKAGGEPEPKQSLLEKLSDLNEINRLGPDNLVLTYGGQEALQLSIQLFEGKRMCGFSPIWSVLLENFVPYSGISFQEIPFKQDFSLDSLTLEKTLKETDVFYLNNPHNPTGKVFSREELSEIGGLCKKYGVFIISDEAYEHIIFDQKRHISLASLPELQDYADIITCFTFSKSFAMTGLRLGYAVTRNLTAADLIKKADYTQTAGVTTPVQAAALPAFSSELMSQVQQRTNELQQRRDVLYQGLKQISGLEVVKPDGGFYFYPHFTHYIPQELEGKERDWHIYKLFMKNGIAIVPGCCFSKQGHFLDSARLSFSTTPVEKIKEGTERMKEILA